VGDLTAAGTAKISKKVEAERQAAIDRMKVVRIQDGTGGGPKK
jgi:hypothetical protein